MARVFEYKGNNYSVAREIKVKMPDGSWAIHILYMAVADQNWYAREKEDFNNKFKPVK